MTYQPTMEEIRIVTLRRFFDAYTDPSAVDLVHSLASVQKTYGANWIDRVNDVMKAMELHDSGLFPDEWLPD